MNEKFTNAAGMNPFRECYASLRNQKAESRRHQIAAITKAKTLTQEAMRPYIAWMQESKYINYPHFVIAEVQA